MRKGVRDDMARHRCSGLEVRAQKPKLGGEVLSLDDVEDLGEEGSVRMVGKEGEEERSGVLIVDSGQMLGSSLEVAEDKFIPESTNQPLNCIHSRSKQKTSTDKLEEGLNAPVKLLHLIFGQEQPVDILTTVTEQTAFKNVEALVKQT